MYIHVPATKVVTKEECAILDQCTLSYTQITLQEQSLPLLLSLSVRAVSPGEVTNTGCHHLQRAGRSQQTVEELQTQKTGILEGSREGGREGEGERGRGREGEGMWCVYMRERNTIIHIPYSSWVVLCM